MLLQVCFALFIVIAEAVSEETAANYRRRLEDSLTVYLK